ncbi:MAG: hypothetical protein S4CHLAM7_04960 [Chlamydiae bacterium]|nr:hypothetical protein [Chlamydiota bacterium]
MNWKKNLLKITALSFFTLTQLVAIDWAGGASADWNTASNWYPTGVPESEESILFANPIPAITASGTPIQLPISTTVSVSALTLGQSGGTISLYPGDLHQFQTVGTVNIDSNLSLATSDYLTILLNNALSINLESYQPTGKSVIQIFSSENSVNQTATLKRFSENTSDELNSIISLVNNVDLVIAPDTADLSDSYAGSIQSQITGSSSPANFSYTPAAANTSLTLSGFLNWTGNTTLNGGTLTLVKPPQDSPYMYLSSDPDAKLVFAPTNTSASYTGVITAEEGISGATFEVNGSNNSVMTFGPNTFQYDGPFNITRGTAYFPIDSTLSASTTTIDDSAVDGTAYLSFNGGTISNDVTVTSGYFDLSNSTNTTTIGGNYTQESNGILRLRIEPNTTTGGLDGSKLLVLGTADLGDGTLELFSGSQGQGFPAASFTILNASVSENALSTGETTGSFGSIVTSGALADSTWTLSYPDNTVVATLSNSITPTRTVSGGNSQDSEINTLLNGNFDTLNSGESESWYAPLNALNSTAYSQAVDNIASKVNYGSLDVRYTQLHVLAQVSKNLDDQYKDTVRKSRFNDQCEIPCFAVENTGLFIQPFGNIWHQNKTTKRTSFKAGSYGIGAGWDQVFKKNFIYEAGLAYSHSNLSVKKAASQNVRWSSVYVSPAFFGWFNAKGYANIMVVGAFNFFNYSRVIKYSNVRRVAKARYNNYEVIVRADGGYRVPVFKSSWFQPEATLNYETMFTDAYKEKGAGTLGLEQKKSTFYHLNPSVRFRMIWETITEKFCFAPSLYVGWTSYISLNDPVVSVRFANVSSIPYVNVQGYKEMINQIALGGEFYMKRFEKFDVKGDFEVDLLNQIQNYRFDLKFEWFF